MDGGLFLMATGMFFLLAGVLPSVVGAVLSLLKWNRHTRFAKALRTGPPKQSLNPLLHHLQTGSMLVFFSLFFFSRPLGKGLTVLKVTGLATAAWTGLAGLVLLLASARSLLALRALWRSGAPDETPAVLFAQPRKLTVFIAAGVMLPFLVQQGFMLRHMVLQTDYYRLLEYGSVAERRAAAAWLAKEPWLLSSTQPLVAAALGDTDSEVRREAARALAAMDRRLPAKEAAALEAALADPDSPASGAAAAGSGSP